MKLRNQVVIVTGGAQGIGAAIATLFALEGAKVIIGDTNEEAGETTATRINRGIPQESPGAVMFKKLNVTDQQSIEDFVGSALFNFKHIDILINNAGITKDARFHKMTEEDFERVYAVNVFGLQRMTKAVLPHMIAKESGVILNASSIVAEHGNIGQANYASSKAAVEAFTKTLAKEFGWKGIRANAVAPGFTNTPMVSAMTEKARAETCAKIPLGRLAEAGEIADAYLFLATNTYVSGAVIPVNGGLVI